jgi:hypothetical protein
MKKPAAMAGFSFDRSDRSGRSLECLVAFRLFLPCIVQETLSMRWPDNRNHAAGSFLYQATRPSSSTHRTRPTPRNTALAEQE